MASLAYPSPDEVIEFNALALALIKAKKADQPKVLSVSKIAQAIEASKEQQGDLYDKAATLMQALVVNHAFASGNRRTAFITAKHFVLANKGRFRIPDAPAYARAMIGIREGYYTREEIKGWIQHGKIRAFRR